MTLGLGIAVSASTAAAQVMCASTMTANGPAQIGTTLQVTIMGNPQCHSCLWVSKNAGPTPIGPVTIPIGLPVLTSMDYGPLPVSGTLVLNIPIPADPNLIGLQIYMTNVGYPAGIPPSLTNIGFSPALVLTITP